MSAKKHPQILLAENKSGSIGYCESCQVVELVIGAISLRVDEQSLEIISALLKDATYRLNVYKKEKYRFTQDLPEELMFH
jgi:hypothetical protein